MPVRVRLLSCLILFVVLAHCDSAGNVARAEDGYGTLTGKFVLKGDVPATRFVIKKGKLVSDGMIPKNPTVCAAKDLPSDALVVDPKTKGIGNIFIYLRKAPAKIHPSLKAPPKQELAFDQEQCRFVPHALFVRTGQTVKTISSDNCSHNLHTYPLKNEAKNFIMPANFKKGVPLNFEAAEFLPMKVGCDIHSWMTAYWLILDHPYAAVTVATAPKTKGGPAIGTFKIEKLPYGEYEFRVWHEIPGYVGVGSKRGFEIKIDKPEIKKEFVVPVATFNAK